MREAAEPEVDPAARQAAATDGLRFERVDATPATTLLMLAGTGFDSGGGPGPVLIIDDGRRQHRFAPIQQPPVPAGLLRAAFQAPASLLHSALAFTLELATGAVIDLPAPTLAPKQLTCPPSESRVRGYGDC